jgi:hypothetical protein
LLDSDRPVAVRSGGSPATMSKNGPRACHFGQYRPRLGGNGTAHPGGTQLTSCQEHTTKAPEETA